MQGYSIQPRQAVKMTASIVPMEKCVKYITVTYTVYVCSMLLESGHSQLNYCTHHSHVIRFVYAVISQESGAGWGLEAEAECLQYMTGVCVSVLISGQSI